MRIQGFRGNCDSQASWGYAPALPTRTQLVFLRTSFQKNEPQATKKFFGAAILQKCCRGVGEQPTFAKQMKFCSLVFLLQLHFLKLPNSELAALREINCVWFGRNASLSACVLFAGVVLSELLMNLS